ncbi:trafficking protein particle complex subunit 6b-like isoform X2 [Clavelina lepadiformis]|uniref:trafficking protein particle complex subunit 6b-like isoform X2 n=1 Tax=Clavelina lepadiformis TaxID=159417 RepID=UPI00404178DE
MSTAGDASSVLFELLHSSLISYVCSSEDNKSKSVSQLEAHGFRVGQSLAEQLTKDTPRFKDDLEIMKFICRDFWNAVYQKQVDNLRTNHQFLAVPCGFVRGALANLGINSVVTAEVISMPAAKFQIMIQRS